VDATRQPLLPDIETTRYTAEQWRSRALYEEACKLRAEDTLARARELLGDALFAAAHPTTSGDADTRPAPTLRALPTTGP
jgi:hypothetical protein